MAIGEKMQWTISIWKDIHSLSSNQRKFVKIYQCYLCHITSVVIVQLLLKQESSPRKYIKNECSWVPVKLIYRNRWQAKFGQWAIVCWPLHCGILRNMIKLQKEQITDKKKYPRYDIKEKNASFKVICLVEYSCYKEL